ncbi:MAG: DUF3696 domain-containing protein [Cyclobacteriaceae bacterium]
MMLRNIRIKNFKAFKEAEITLGNLNLFTGLNGMGKSSFIQVLLLLRQEYLKLGVFDEELTLKGNLINVGLGSDIKNIDSSDDVIEFELEWDDEKSLLCTIDYTPDLSNFDILEAWYKEEDGYEDKSLFNYNFEYLNALRIVPSLTFPVSSHHVLHENSLGVNGEYSMHYLYQNQREKLAISTLKHPDTADKEELYLLNQVDKWMGYISPGVKFTPSSLFDLEVSSVGVSFENGRIETKQFKSPNVGFGITYALPVVLAILKSKPGDMIIIENPESHIHPRGQAYIGELCAKAAEAGVQIIIETHSDHVLNGVRVAAKRKDVSADNVSIFFFERNTSSDEHYTNIVEPYLDENGRISDWPKDFFDEWSKRLDELI